LTKNHAICVQPNGGSTTVSAFDALGKALRVKHSEIPARPINLFQNFLKLDEVLATITGKHISQFLTPADRSLYNSLCNWSEPEQYDNVLVYS
jgi:hypothetical protein